MVKDGEREHQLRLELRRMRRHGLTPTALAESPYILMAPRVINAAAASGPKETIEQVACRVLAERIESSPRSRRVEALRKAMNLELSPLNLTARRRAHAHALGVTVDTIENYENAYIDELIDWLLSENTTTPVGKRAGVEYDFQCQLVQLDLLARLGSEPYVVFETRTVEAEVEGASEFLVFVDYPDVPGEVSVTALDNCAVTRRFVTDRGYYLHVAELERPLSIGQRTKFRIRREVPPTGERQSRLVLTPRVPVQRLVLDINFGRSAPTRAWRVDHLPLKLLPGDPDSAPPVAISKYAFANETFDNLEASWTYGIAWEWPPES